MATLCAKIELLDDQDRVIVTEWAYGNTERAVDAAAGALRRQLEIEYEDDYPGCNGIIGRTVKA